MSQPLTQTNEVYARITRNGQIPLDPPNSFWESGNEAALQATRDAAYAITAAWVAGEITTQELANEHMRLIAIDIKSGQVPASVASVSELHDHVDANTYTLEIMGLDMSDDGARACNTVLDAVSAMLSTGNGS